MVLLIIYKNLRLFSWKEKKKEGPKSYKGSLSNQKNNKCTLQWKFKKLKIQTWSDGTLEEVEVPNHYYYIVKLKLV
jgi:hypothetical protein